MNTELYCQKVPPHGSIYGTLPSHRACATQDSLGILSGNNKTAVQSIAGEKSLIIISMVIGTCKEPIKILETVLFLPSPLRPSVLCSPGPIYSSSWVDVTRRAQIAQDLFLFFYVKFMERYAACGHLSWARLLSWPHVESHTPNHNCKTEGKKDMHSRFRDDAILKSRW